MNRLEMVTDNLERVIRQIKDNAVLQKVDTRQYFPISRGIDYAKLKHMHFTLIDQRPNAERIPPVLLIEKNSHNYDTVYESINGTHRWIAHFAINRRIEAVVIKERLWNKFRDRLTEYEEECIRLERPERPEKDRSDYYREVIAWIERQT